MRDEQEFIERRILTGLIVSKDYLDRINKFWDANFMESSELRKIAQWSFSYYKKYNKAPDDNIQSIYMGHLQSGNLPKSEAQYIEEVLQGLSDEYGRDQQFNSAYLYDQTISYCKKRELERHNEDVQDLITAGKIEEAEQLAKSFIPLIVEDEDRGLDLSSADVLDRIDHAFNDTAQRVIEYPGALGNMWNEHLIRGGFVSLLAPEKRGKSWLLMEMGMRAVRQKANVAFFSAGDMTESQMLRRICIYVAQKSDREKYCQGHFRPVGDCIFNQLDSCDRGDRNCDHGVFEGIPLETFLEGITQFVNLDTLKEKHDKFREYEPCDSTTCEDRRSTVWIKKVKKTSPLTAKNAKEKLAQFFSRYKRRFKLITTPAGILTVENMAAYLNNWERYDGFVPDVIIIDYADLLSAGDSHIKEFRHQQDHVWKRLRALSQEKHALVITATQANAESYKRGRLSISNFSEDKRKLSHVTAQYGLNQDTHGREKKLGMMRINEIVVREGEFSPDSEVMILQDLAIGRPFLESFR